MRGPCNPQGSAKLDDTMNTSTGLLVMAERKLIIVHCSCSYHIQVPLISPKSIGKKEFKISRVCEEPDLKLWIQAY